MDDRASTPRSRKSAPPSRKATKRIDGDGKPRPTASRAAKKSPTRTSRTTKAAATRKQTPRAGSKPKTGAKPKTAAKPKTDPKRRSAHSQPQGQATAVVGVPEPEHSEIAEAGALAEDANTVVSEQATAAQPVVSERRRRLYRIPVLGAIVYLVAPPRSRRPSGIRKWLSGASAVVALLGMAMFFYPVAGHRYPGFLSYPVEKGIEWSNLFSDLESNRIQGRLNVAFEEKTLASDRVAEGEPLTRLQIPKLKVDTIVVEGTSSAALKAGAGHYPQTPLPGRVGNVAIAGHRTTYGRPFNRVDELRTGDEVILTTPVGRFTYKLTTDPWVTSQTDWSVIDQTSDAVLTLTTCHPKGSDRQRLIVRAELVRSEPAARAKSAA